MDTANDKVVRFGDFELDKGRRLLRTLDGRDVQLSARVMDTLLCLVEKPGELIEKRELLDAVWPSVVVEENNLTQAISALRRALGEEPREHRYIVTVPGRGYRFVARLESAGDAAGIQPVPASEANDSGSSRSMFVRAMVAVITVVALIWLLDFRSPENDGGADGIRLVDHALVTQGQANHRQPTLSPDGSLVAFVSDETGTDQIYVQNIADGGPHPVTDMAGGAGHPSWSPTNDRIIFHSLERGGIWSVGILGDPPPRLLIPEGKNPSFSPDGSTIVYEFEQEIRFADRDGSGQRSVPGFSAHGWLTANLFPSPSPDGRAIVVLRAENTPLGDYWVVPVDGSEMRQLTFDQTEGGRPFWAADGYIYFASERAGTRSIWRVPGVGGEPQPVTNSTGRDDDPTVSRDGTRLVYANTRLETRFIVRASTDGSRAEVYRSLSKASFPKVSNDGRHIAFFRKSDPEEQLFLMDTDSWDSVQLTHTQGGERRIMPRWSHDDNTLYFYEVTADLTNWSLQALPVEGGPAWLVFAEFPWLGNMDLEWDPNGERIVFIQRDPINPLDAESIRVVIREIDSGRESEHTWPIAYGPAWSADGRQILGAAVDAVVVCTIATDDCRTVVSGLDINNAWAIGGLGHYARWSNDESRIFFNRRSNQPGILELWVVNRDGSSPERLFDYGPVDPLDGRFQVLSGDRILWNELAASHQTELWVATLSRIDIADAGPTPGAAP